MFFHPGCGRPTFAPLVTSATNVAVITRFTDALKASIAALQARQQRFSQSYIDSRGLTVRTW